MPTNGYSFQQELVTYSSPTLIKMKTGSLFSVSKESFPDLDECLAYFNDHLESNHLQITIIREDEKRILLYIYNKQSLNRLWDNDNIRSFLIKLGYKENNLLEQLIRRFQTEKCPHEVGIFLGYPFHDVLSFIYHDSRDPLIGHWLAYSHQENARKTFYKYDCSTRFLNEQIKQGAVIFDIIDRVK